VNSTGPYNSAKNTIEACAAACSGYGYFGVEYGVEVSLTERA
jgi:hypothetical protein